MEPEFCSQCEADKVDCLGVVKWNSSFTFIDKESFMRHYCEK